MFVSRCPIAYRLAEKFPKVILKVANCVLSLKRAKAFYDQPLHFQEESWEEKKEERKRTKEEAPTKRFQV